MTGWIASTFPLRGRAASETKMEGWELLLRMQSSSHVPMFSLSTSEWTESVTEELCL